MTTVATGECEAGCHPVVGRLGSLTAAPQWRRTSDTTLRRPALGARESDASRETLEELRREIEDLRASRARLVRAADADRQGIERELHDGVQQRLVALAVILQLVEAAAESDPRQARVLLDEMARAVQRALDDASRLAARIYPSTFATAGLPAALRSKAASAGIPVAVRIEAEGTYPPEILGTIYWSFVEMLDGADVGAAATVSVQDDGVGLAFEIVVERLSSDVALDGLRDRVEALGGHVAFESARGRAVRVSGSLPHSRRD
jgi:signal transduction histidine kinase